MMITTQIMDQVDHLDHPKFDKNKNIFFVFLDGFSFQKKIKYFFVDFVVVHLVHLVQSKSKEDYCKMTFPLVSADLGPKQRKQLLRKKKEQQKTKNREPETILTQRIHPTSGKWICNSCSWTGDRFFMEVHPCKRNIKNNFEKVAQNLEYGNERYR